MVSHVPKGAAAIVTPEPYVAWAMVATLFHPVPPPHAGIHPNAVIGAHATIDPTAEIGPLAVIGDGAAIGPRCRVGALAVIGPGVVLGPDCRIGPHASLSHALLGARVYVYPGARIGQEGFGFAISGEGFHSVPQLCRVILEDDVEVGANTTIDRGSLQDTVVGAGSRLDNLVQIGHNARLGRGCVIVSQAGVSGSTILEDHVMVGPQAGLTGHLRIGRMAKIGAQAGVMTDVEAGTEVVGSPAQPRRAFFREVAILRRMARGSGKGAGNRGEGNRSAGDQGTDHGATGEPSTGEPSEVEVDTGDQRVGGRAVGLKDAASKRGAGKGGASEGLASKETDTD
jgi:UDP-3-O-[3-hydroxymyristoyl] glucosamine N-acyltransferase